MATPKTSFSRPGGKKKQNARVLIICEDSQSSLNYIKQARDHYELRIDVDAIFCNHTDPAGILNHAIKNKKNYDKIFCVLDKDSHPSYDSALVNAKQHYPQIEIIQSVPCFELWLILHFKYSTKPYNRNKSSPGQLLLSDLLKIPEMINYTKGTEDNLFKYLINHLGIAKTNAKKLEQHCLSLESYNPYTKLHHLIKYLSEYKTKQSN